MDPRKACWSWREGGTPCSVYIRFLLSYYFSIGVSVDRCSLTRPAEAPGICLLRNSFRSLCPESAVTVVSWQSCVRVSSRQFPFCARIWEATMPQLEPMNFFLSSTTEAINMLNSLTFLTKSILLSCQTLLQLSFYTPFHSFLLFLGFQRSFITFTYYRYYSSTNCNGQRRFRLPMGWRR